MNRILTLGVLALGLILGSQQQASAWCNFKFGAGVNWNYQSGNNCFLWGLCRSGEIPGPEFFGSCCPSGCPSPYMNYGGGPDCFAGNGGPGPAYAGMQNYGQNYGAPGAAAYANGPQQYPQTPAAATGTTPQKNPATTIPNYQSGQSPYQPTSGSYPANYPANRGRIPERIRTTRTTRTGRTATTAAVTTTECSRRTTAGTGTRATDIDRQSDARMPFRIDGNDPWATGRAGTSERKAAERGQDSFEILSALCFAHRRFTSTRNGRRLTSAA